MTKISDMAILRIRKNKKIIGRIAIQFDKHYRSVEVWVENRSPMLTTPDAVRIISEETGLTESEILDESEIAA